MCPVGVPLEPWRLTGDFVCHCLLVETDDGLVLIDTGLGLRDIEHGLPKLFEWSCRPSYNRNEAAISQVEALGFRPEDVRHIITTHLDLDHAGGISDFPHAVVHTHALEREASQERNHNGKMRYAPEQWAHDVRWQTYSVAGDRWQGLEAVRQLEGVDAPICLIPLPGHSRGHCGVAVEDDKGGWLFHCGDAFFHRHQIAPEEGKTPLMIRVFQDSMVENKRLRDQNIERLRTLHREHPDDITIICAHDAHTFDALK